jgi:hypothetical protein
MDGTHDESKLFARTRLLRECWLIKINLAKVFLILRSRPGKRILVWDCDLQSTDLGKAFSERVGDRALLIL